MIDVIETSSENIITLCKYAVVFYILMQISEAVVCVSVANEGYWSESKRDSMLFPT